MVEVSQATDPLAHHGEGPVWDASSQSLWWVDMLAGDVLTMTHRGSRVDRHHVGDVAAALRPRASGGAVAAVERGFVVLDESWQPVAPMVEVWADSTVRMNDGACDPQGRFYCGSMAYDAATGRGSLHRFDPDGSVHLVLDGVTVSNGLAWSNDGTQTVYVDSPTQRVDLFDFDVERGALDNRRPLVSIPEEVGMPDGLTVDAEGGVWVALWDGGAVHRYTAAGQLDAVIPLPVRRVTACTFGGPALQDFYITTSREGVPDGEQPLAGSLFHCRPGSRGVPALTYAG